MRDTLSILASAPQHSRRAQDYVVARPVDCRPPEYNLRRGAQGNLGRLVGRRVTGAFCHSVAPAQGGHVEKQAQSRSHWAIRRWPLCHPSCWPLGHCWLGSWHVAIDQIAQLLAYTLVRVSGQLSKLPTRQPLRCCGELLGGLDLLLYCTSVLLGPCWRCKGSALTCGSPNGPSARAGVLGQCCSLEWASLSVDAAMHHRCVVPLADSGV